LNKIAEPELAAKARWVISTQLILSIIIALFFLIKGAWQAGAALYGGLASLCITLLLLWAVKRASQTAQDNPGKGIRMLYVSAAQRFLLAMVLLAMGIAVFKLDPLAVIAGFVFTQLSYWVGARVKSP
jgi:F0F1-type ATP synthase assembly protein I